MISETLMQNQKNKSLFNYNLFMEDFKKDTMLNPNENQSLYIAYYNLRVNIESLTKNATFFSNLPSQISQSKMELVEALKVILKK